MNPHTTGYGLGLVAALACLVTRAEVVIHTQRGVLLGLMGTGTGVIAQQHRMVLAGGGCVQMGDAAEALAAHAAGCGGPLG